MVLKEKFVVSFIVCYQRVELHDAFKRRRQKVNG